MRGEKVSTYLVTYWGDFICDVSEEDVDKLSIKEPGTHVTLYNLTNPKNSKIVELEKTIETSSIISRLY